MGEAPDQRCGASQDKPRRLHIHHIAPFTVKEIRSEIANLVLLCAKCHKFVHSPKNIAHEYVREGGGNGTPRDDA